MDNDYIYSEWLQDESFIANGPWVNALKMRKAGTLTSDFTVTSPQCNNRFSYKLQCIGRDGRSPVDNESWNKVIEHSEKQARLRAVQLHLSCVATFAASGTPSRAVVASLYLQHPRP